MFYKYIKPSGILADYIKYYWVLEIGASEGYVTERVIPTGNIQLLFHYKNPFLDTAKGKKSAQHVSFISGLSGNYCDVSTDGDSGVIAVVFHPHGACNFFSFPLREVENESVNLLDIDSGGIREVEDRIRDVPSLEGKIAVLEGYLLSRLVPVGTDNDRLIRGIVSRINRTGGRISVRELSGDTAMAEKTLERKFANYIGTMPKPFLRIVRFQDTVSRLSRIGKGKLTDFAYDNGYFDQAHFINDFKSMSGYTPKEFLALGPCSSDYFA